MSEFLLWFAAIFVVLWLWGWILNILPIRVATAFDTALEKTNDYLPLSMWPVEHTLLSLLLGGLAVLIAAFPRWDLWAFIVVPATEGGLGPGVLLGPAAALLALLLFAANQVQNLERDAGSGHLYLGENVRTFLARRSRVVKMLALPVFHVAVSALFIVPLIWSGLPATATTPTLGTALPSVEWSPQMAAIAFWCASFGVVSGVLLLNVLNTLRNSTLGFRAPTGIESLIRDSLRNRSAHFYRELFQRSTDLLDMVDPWVKNHVAKASNLPEAEHRTYFENTIGVSEYTEYQDDAIEKCHRLLKRPQRLLGVGRFGRGLSSKLLAWRLNRAERFLKKRTELAHERVCALLTSWRDTDLSDEARDWLIEQCLREARNYDTHAIQFLSTETPGLEKFKVTGHDLFDQKARDILTAPAEEIRGLDRGMFSYDRSEQGPEVGVIPVFTYRVLASLLLPNASEDKRSRTTSKMLHRIIDAAARLRHAPSREVALRDMVKAVIDSVIVGRPDNETLPLNILTEREYFRSGALFLGSSNRLARQEAIEDQAMAALTANTDLHADARSALLELLPERLRPTALLYLLVYKSRTMRSLTSIDLCPFFEALRKFRWSGCEDRQEAVTVALEYFRRSYLKDYVTSAGISWVFQTLEKPLTLELCVEFLKANIAGLSLMHFIQWRALGGEVFYGDYSGEFPTEPALHGPLMSLKSDLQQFATDWKTVDPLTAEKLEVLLWRFPPA